MSQSKIDVEADAGRILRRIVDADPVATITAVPKSGAIKWLLAKGYVYQSGMYSRGCPLMSITIKGREYYEGLCKNPFPTTSPRAWVDEARSQLAVKSGPLGTVTRESTITRAVIPGVQAPHTTRTPEDAMNEMQGTLAAQAKWCAALDVTPDELRELWGEGRIRHCNGCESVGIFDRDRGGWKSRCRKCRKDRRGR